MRTWFAPALFLCICAGLGATAPGHEVVRVGGTGVGSGGLQALAKAYMQRHPEHSILVLPSIGSSGGIRATLDGKLDVGCSSRPLQPEERAPGLAEVPWVTTAFVFATQSSAPAEPLTLAGIEDIYAGRRTHWKDGRPIRLILRPKSDSAHAYLSGFTPGMPAALERAHALRGVCVGITDPDSLTYLEKTPGSFGTTVLGLLASGDRQVQALTVNGASPLEPAYPFALTLILIHRPEKASSATRAFLDFTRSKEGHRILIKAGYQPLPAEPPQPSRR